MGAVTVRNIITESFACETGLVGDMSAGMRVIKTRCGVLIGPVTSGR
jgi:hypothetical protein